MSRKIVSLFLALLLMLGMTAALAENGAVAVTDMYGRQITLSEPVTRIVALTPADCEILWGAAARTAISPRTFWNCRRCSPARKPMWRRFWRSIRRWCSWATWRSPRSW